jgi:hypothetical protein
MHARPDDQPETDPAPVDPWKTAEDQAAAAAEHAATAGDAAPEPDVLRVERSGLDHVTADQVEVRVGGIGSVEADDVFVQWGGIGGARATTVGVEFGSIGGALAREVRLTQGVAGSVIAKDATVEQGLVRTLIGWRVTFARPSAVLIVIANRVEGGVRPLVSLDWRAGLALGVSLGVISTVAGYLRRR